jgi:hypothetical protein
MTALSYFAEHGPITQPGECGSLLAGLPADVPSLVRVVQGALVHVFWAQRYGLALTPERQAEVQLRWVSRQLAAIAWLDPRPLVEPRPLDRKLVGNCRDHSVLLAALLREQGIPARARCGFARYFMPNHYEDHWVCEYWHAGQARWVLVDSQLDELQRGVLAIPFDPLDTPRDQFIVGGEAWRLCRAGQADPNAFGIHDMHGLWFVLGDFIRDVASLNKVELLPWDVWGLMPGPDQDLSPDDIVFLDEVALLASGAVPEHDRLAALYAADSRLRVPGHVMNFGPNGPVSIEIPRT